MRSINNINWVDKRTRWLDKIAETNCALQILLVATSYSQAVSNIPIQHFIFIVQENHSFDNYFGTFPGARFWLSYAPDYRWCAKSKKRAFCKTNRSVHDLALLGIVCDGLR